MSAESSILPYKAQTYPTLATGCHEDLQEFINELLS